MVFVTLVKVCVFCFFCAIVGSVLWRTVEPGTVVDATGKALFAFFVVRESLRIFDEG